MLNYAVRIVFQFRKRCTIPTCAVKHHARGCWRRFLAGRFRSSCSVYAVWTALRKFSLRIKFVLSISFLSFVKHIPSIKLFLRYICDDNLIWNDKKIGQFYRVRKIWTFINLLCCCDAYFCVCKKNLGNVEFCHCE